MRPARMKTPAAAPTAAPLARPVTFSVSSALASAISSRTSSEAFSETSWIALPSSDVCWSVMGQSTSLLRMRAIRNAPAKAMPAATSGRSSGLGSRRLAGAGARYDAAADGGGGGVGVRSQPGRHHVRAGEVRGGASPALPSRGPASRRWRPARARACASACACSARSLALRSLRESFSSAFSAASVSSWAFAVSSSARRASVSRSSCAQLGAARLGGRALGLGLRLARGGGLGRLLGGRARGGLGLLAGVPGERLLLVGGVPLLRALGVVVFHSGGSSPKMRRNTTAAIAGGHDRGQGADAGEQAGPGQALDEIVVGHGGGVYAARPPTMVRTMWALASSYSALALREQAEDPSGQHLLDRAVERHDRELGRDLGAELAGLLRLLDHAADQRVGLADLADVRRAERVRGARDLDDDHLHQVGIVTVGLDDEARDRGQLLLGGDVLARRSRGSRPAGSPSARGTACPAPGPWT